MFCSNFDSVGFILISPKVGNQHYFLYVIITLGKI